MKPIHNKVIGLTVLSLLMGAPQLVIAQPLEKTEIALNQIQQEQLPQILVLQEQKEETKQNLLKQFIEIAQNSDVTTLDLRMTSGLTEEQIYILLKGTKLEGLEKAFVKAEKDYGVNAYYLIAHAAWESGWGTSTLAKNKNNLFGFSAYDNSAYTSATSFKSKGECVNVVAKFIREHYLEQEGDHYNEPNLKGINIKYASDKNWAKGIAEIIQGLIEKTQENNLV